MQEKAGKEFPRNLVSQMCAPLMALEHPLSRQTQVHTPQGRLGCKRPTELIQPNLEPLTCSQLRTRGFFQKRWDNGIQKMAELSGSAEWSQELDSVILVSPFQLGPIYDSIDLELSHRCACSEGGGTGSMNGHGKALEALMFSLPTIQLHLF